LLPINTIVILVVLLVLITVVLILVSRGGSNFTNFGEDKIGIAGDTSECELKCYQCCRIDSVEHCNDQLYHSDTTGCICIC
jgi:hypothetical protein